ncbi:restriction endonuclease subunit S [Tenacibaculum finnmarkense]|uniref:restriction endonuclease subunit S n=1 Tax=Tenacibaculum finnmarkense TaxID=2781243 RepID=UPI003BB5F1C6
METITKNNIKKYSTYKNSGVEWLGEIPEHWDLGRLGSILNPVSSKNHPNKILLSITREKGVIVRDIENEDTNHNFIPDDLTGYKLLKKGQFGMNKMKAWQGSYGVSDYTGIVSPAYYTFEFTKDIEPKFFHIAIRSKLYVSFFGKASDGVRIGQWDLSKDRMKRIPLAIPPLSEQTKIAEFLDDKTKKIDEAIAIKTQQINLLKERKQILIHKAVTRGLDTNVKLKNSGVEWIGEIPVHWEVKKLKDLCKAFGRIGFRGYTISDLVNKGNGAITISPSNIKEEFMTFEKCSYLSWNKYKESPEIQIFNGNILIVKTGSTFGKIGLVKDLPQKATINPQLLVLKEIKINPYYFYSVLKTSMIQIQIQQQVIGSTIPTISETKILNFKIVLPPYDEIEKTVVYLEDINTKFKKFINLKQQEIEKLKEYKSSLINSVVTGKVRVC